MATARLSGAPAPHHAVLIAPGLWLASPKNGNISNVGRRLSAISLPSCSNWEYRDGQKTHKKPQLAATYRVLRPPYISREYSPPSRGGIVLPYHHHRKTYLC